MVISVFGLGYVGAVCAACLADKGHNVIGVEPNSLKRELVNKGHSPIIEAELEEIIGRVVAQGRLSATADAYRAIQESDISLICVGTPSLSDGSFDSHALEKVCEEIGTALAEKVEFHVVVIRSTILPGTMNKLVIPALERASGKLAGVDFGVCNNPEFMREGNAVADFYHPAKIIIGASDDKSGDMVQALYEGFPGTMLRCSIEVGEMAKYGDNLWHACKVAFANEIGKLCKLQHIDSHRVMDVLCADNKLNISAAYMRPGFAFGGSCLPKDIRAMVHKAQSMNVTLPLLESLLPSNEEQVTQGVAMVQATGKKRIGLLGFSFKAGTDDLRESPLLEMVKRLKEEDFDVRIYDRNVDLSRLTGANRAIIFDTLPQIESLLTERISTVFEHAEVIVIGNEAPEFTHIAQFLQPEQTVIDLVRIKAIEESHANYQGISW